MRTTTQETTNQFDHQTTIGGNGVVLTDFASDTFNNIIKQYTPPVLLRYTFNNPGRALISQRPNPDTDPLRIDTSTETWRWRKMSRVMYWNDIILISPLKEAMKEYCFGLIGKRTWTTACAAYAGFKKAQDLMKDPSEWPWTTKTMLRILAGLVDDKRSFPVVRDFYVWAEGMGIPGFHEDTARRIYQMQPRRGRHNEQQGVKVRKHVLSLCEEIKLRNALSKTEPFDRVPIPMNAGPDQTFNLFEIGSWLGWGVDAKRRLVRKNLNRVIQDALGATPCGSYESETGATITIYKANDVIQPARRYLLGEQINFLRQNIMTHLAYALGPRPAQISGIDEEGFRKTEINGEVFYTIELPRRKKRFATKTTKRRKFPAEIGLGQKIERFIELKRQAEALGAFFFEESTVTPLFVGTSQQTDSQLVRNGFYTVKEFVEPVRVTRVLDQAVGMMIINFMKLNADISRSARDLRSNAGQRLADAGYSATVIAEVLDHSRPETVNAYVQAAMGLSEILEQALATHDNYSEFIAKLKGRKIINLKDISKDADVISGTVNRSMISKIGVCNKNNTGLTPCELEPVYSCYGCADFHPFDDVLTHNMVLEALEGEVLVYAEIADDSQEPTKLALTHRETILNVKAVIEIVNSNLGQS
ncbi:hypothetical protein [Noviherbaspirillum suwonense]|uniref:Integrase n=1 Tax=Noviherbaspirillum suwonense TaxID=1224511 RepID=A0ABY1Q7H7_9BURK|nr:hypothetical protein [Noviherbaspirillum suwonense]SMP57953.1 hypothetical protein SAMN06295970_105186 [Noviherbaspirillum suwonense]